MWSKEWEEKCLEIHQAEADEQARQAAKEKEAKAALFAVDIKPTTYVRGTKIDICGSALKDNGLEIKPTVVPSKAKRAARAADLEKDEPPALTRRPSIGRAAARRPSRGRQRSLSRGRASRSNSRGRALSKTRECTTQPENDEENPRLRHKSTTKKKKKAAKDGTKKKKKVKTPEPEPEPVETPLMRRRSRSITRKQIYESGSEDDDRSREEWSDDAMSEDEIPLSRPNAWLHTRSASIARSESDDAISDEETPITHGRRSRSKKRQLSISEKGKHGSDESPLRRRRSRSKTRQSSFTENCKQNGDDLAFETEIPLHRRRSRSKTKRSSITEKGDNSASETESPLHRCRSRSKTRKSSITENGDDSASETESPLNKCRSRSRARESSNTEKGKSEPQQRRSGSRHRRLSSEAEDELGGSKHKVIRRATLADAEGFKGSEQPAPDRLSRRMSQKDGCEGTSWSVTKRTISANDFEAACQSSDTESSERGRRSSRCIERSGSARKLSERSFSPGRTVSEQVILFDDGDEEACTSSNLVPESTSSKKSNVLMQHLQSLEDAPESAKMTPGKMKKRMVMVRSNSFGRRRSNMAADTDDSDSDYEPRPARKGPLKSPSRVTTRQSSILRRNSKFAGKESIDCPDLNSSNDWYKDSHSVVAI